MSSVDTKTEQSNQTATDHYADRRGKNWLILLILIAFTLLAASVPYFFFT